MLKAFFNYKNIAQKPPRPSDFHKEKLIQDIQLCDPKGICNESCPDML